MGRRLPSPYEYFGATEEELNEILDELNEEDKELFYERYGKNLHSPVSSKTFNASKANDYYNELAPRMREILDEIRERQLQDYSEEAILEIMEEMDEIVEEDNSLENLLIESLTSNKSNVEICRELGIESDELYKMLFDLKSKGREINAKYYSDGSIHYHGITSLDFLDTVNSFGPYKTLFTDVSEQKVKFLLISDLHFGNELARLDLVDRAFDYCIKNDIHTILCGGDLIDGAIGKGTRTISDVREQLDYFINNYPHDDSIITFSVAGDHDASAIDAASLNIAKLCDNYRPDVVIGGFENMFLNVKNDQIMIHHCISKNKMPGSRAPIVIHGHSHKYLIDAERDKIDILVPTLSNIHSDFPSALELDVEFKNGYFSTTSIKQIYFGEKDVVLGETKFDLIGDLKNEKGPVRYQENYKGRSKTL